MNSKEVMLLNGVQFSTEQGAKDAIKSILELTGVKETQKDSYTEFITLQKTILLRAGVELYSIWIKNTYNEADKKVWELSFQTDYSFSLTIGRFIRECVDRNVLLLTDEMKTALSIN